MEQTQNLVGQSKIETRLGRVGLLLLKCQISSSSNELECGVEEGLYCGGTVGWGQARWQPCSLDAGKCAVLTVMYESTLSTAQPLKSLVRSRDLLLHFVFPRRMPAKVCVLSHVCPSILLHLVRLLFTDLKFILFVHLQPEFQ